MFKWCANLCKFNSLKYGYFDYCDPGCVGKATETKEKRMTTLYNKYGVTHNLHDPILLQKQKARIKKTILNRNEEMKEKNKNHLFK